MIVGASVPCCESAITASDVILAQDDAPLMTNTSGLSIPRTSSTVRPADLRSCGLGRVGTTTMSEISTTRLMVLVDRGRRVDDQQLVAHFLRALGVDVQAEMRGLDQRRLVGSALFPPVGQARLRVRVEQGHRSGAHAFRLHGEVARKRRLARTTLLGGQG